MAELRPVPITIQHERRDVAPQVALAFVGKDASGVWMVADNVASRAGTVTADGGGIHSVNDDPNAAGARRVVRLGLIHVLGE